MPAPSLKGQRPAWQKWGLTLVGALLLFLMGLLPGMLGENHLPNLENDSKSPAAVLESAGEEPSGEADSQEKTTQSDKEEGEESDKTADKDSKPSDSENEDALKTATVKKGDSAKESSTTSQAPPAEEPPPAISAAADDPPLKLTVAKALPVMLKSVNLAKKNASITKKTDSTAKAADSLALEKSKGSIHTPSGAGKTSSDDADGEILYEEDLPPEDEGAEAASTPHAVSDIPPLARIPKSTATSPATTTTPTTTATKGLIPVALIIDDLGYNGKVSEAIAKLPGEITLAVLPGGPSSRRVTKLGVALGKEIILHQPMEPKGYPKVNPGPGVILVEMDEGDTQRVLVENLKKFPEVVGINNHMGSRLTEKKAHMAWVMDILVERGLYFLDSRTSTKTVGYSQAKANGVPRAQRDIFIDNVRNETAILKQLAKLEKRALKKNGAVGIGHPYPATLRAIKKWQVGLSERGLVLQPASHFLTPLSARTLYRKPDSSASDLPALLASD
ncbi:MAG: divergent polysaccharide deacetylase family protein [Magnetococcales bacterium]|nr:divergent polysaccharide deacetylase family protein [Magnetococcales bacterium]